MVTLLYILEFIGIITFAFSGMLMAEKKDFDPVGWYIVACVTAFGGGTLRDVIMDNHPVYWVIHWQFPVIILGLTAIFYFLSRFRIPHSVLIVSDAMGLSLFTITTAQALLATDTPPIIVLILSVMTASFGGLLRDVLCNEVPMIFQKVSLYASVSFIGSALYWLLTLTAIPSSLAIGIGSVFIFGFRLFAYKYNLRFR